MSKSDVIAVLSSIIRQYDLVVVQEIRDKSNTAAHELLEVINLPLVDKYSLLLSDRLGHSTSKEQYGYYYKGSVLAPL